MPLRRSFVSAGIALLDAGAIAAAPVTPPPAQVRAAGIDVTLTAAAAVDSCVPTATALCEPSSGARAPGQGPATRAAAAPSIFNIPANLFIALANVPYNFFNALWQGDVNLGDRPDSGFAFVNSRNGVDLNQTEVVGLTADLEYGASCWVYHPFNVLGTDAADIARYQSLVNVLLPFPALSVGLGNTLATVAASQLPMDVGCTGLNEGGCDRPGQLLSKMFNVGHIVELFSPGGYTFPEVENPITCTSDGLCGIKDPDGQTEPWSEQNSRLNIGTPFQNVFESLTETPDFSRIRLPSLTMIVNTIAGFIRGLNTAFNPFVLGTQCGLCSALIPGIPGDEDPATELSGERNAGSRESDDAGDATPDTVRSAATDTGKTDTEKPSSEEAGISGGTEATSPPADDVRRGHVDDSGDVASEGPGDDGGSAQVPAKSRWGHDTKSEDPKSGDMKRGDSKPESKNRDSKPDSSERQVREREAA